MGVPLWVASCTLRVATDLREDLAFALFRPLVPLHHEVRAHPCTPYYIPNMPMYREATCGRRTTRMMEPNPRLRRDRASCVGGTGVAAGSRPHSFHEARRLPVATPLAFNARHMRLAAHGEARARARPRVIQAREVNERRVCQPISTRTQAGCGWKMGL
jgi:hypothetical protein